MSNVKKFQVIEIYTKGGLIIAQQLKKCT